jgi:hypothetical protein
MNTDVDEEETKDNAWLRPRPKLPGKFFLEKHNNEEFNGTLAEIRFPMIVTIDNDCRVCSFRV